MLNLQAQLKLQQKLSPQQIQYIKLLQLNNLALEQRIHAELQANPMLEEAADMAEGVQDGPDAEPGSDDDFDWEELLPAGDEDFYGHKARVDWQERSERPLPAEESLTEHLRAQLSLLNLSRLDLLMAEQIIGSIDEDGYLRRDTLSIVDDLIFTQGETVTTDDVERVIQRIQRLDPVGIAARSLQECLAIQLEVLPEGMPGREIALAILSRVF